MKIQPRKSYFSGWVLYEFNYEKVTFERII
jgi:hypothetical protein